MSTNVTKLRFGSCTRSVLATALVVSMAGLSLGLGGCAVTTIDVDVYKGPLANERQVQVQEASMLAIGAKPLLKQLRNNLESKAICKKYTRPEKYLAKFSSAIDDAKTNGVAKVSWNTDGNAWLDNFAGRVNAVLSLYDRRTDSVALPEEFVRLSAALERYRQSRDRLRPNPVPEYRKELARKLLTLNGDNRLQGNDFRAKTDATAAKAYIEALDPRSVYGTYLFYDEHIVGTHRLGIFHLEQDQQLDTTAVFSKLSNSDAVSKDLATLYGGLDARDREAIAQEVATIAGAFIDSRIALTEAIDAATDIGLWASSNLSGAQRADVLDAISRLIPLLLGSGETLRSVLNTLQDPASRDASTDQLRSRIAERVRTYPEFSLAEIRGLAQARDQFGVARIAAGPTKEAGAFNVESVRLVEALQVAISAGGFEHGRPLRGIDELTDAFADRAQSCATMDDELGGELTAALIQFAEKTLYLANFSTLADQDAGEKLSRKESSRSLQAVGNAIIVQLNELQAWDNANERQRRRTNSTIDANECLMEKSKLPKPKSDLRPIDVMDAVIVELEAKLREEIANDDNASVARLRAALNEAYEQRTRMVYIRPPSFYLKNSYPVTSLQDNSSQGPWKNMLAQQAWRGVPFVNMFKDKTNAETQKRLDQLYWQNINRVRVAATGITNYVIAKDPVGNWYVKNYSGDPSPIIKAAKAAAMMGAGMPSLYPTGTPEQAKSAEGFAAVNTATPTIVDRQREFFKKNYAAATTADRGRLAKLEELVTKDDELRATIKGALDATKLNTDETKLAPTSVFEAATKSRADLKSSDDAGIIGVLQKFDDGRRAVLANINTAKAMDGVSDKGAADAREKLRLAVNKRLGGAIIDALDARLRTIGSYRDGLQVIGESTTPVGPQK